MKDIIEQIFTTEHDGTNIECLCDVLFNNFPDGVIVKVLEVNGIESCNFKRDYVSDIADKIHEQIVNEQAEKSLEQKDYYDEGDR